MKKVLSILGCISSIGMFVVLAMLLVLQNTISYEKASTFEITTKSDLFVIMENNHILGCLFIVFGLFLAIITIINLLYEKKKTKIGSRKKDSLEQAYEAVYKDLCENHAHVMAVFNGTLHKDDVYPTTTKVNIMIQDIVNRGKNQAS